jgi:ATP-dependent RNA helicase DDX31/DBP7
MKKRTIQSKEKKSDQPSRQQTKNEARNMVGSGPNDAPKTEQRPVKAKTPKPLATLKPQKPEAGSSSSTEASETLQKAPAAKSSYQPRSLEEDPHQFHARPRDLSRNALSRPQAKFNSSHIFTETPFSSLGLEERLATHLEKSRDAGGLGLSSTTRIQNVVIPSVLHDRQNVLMKSETGSGKTLAYLLPIMNDLMTLPEPVNRSQGTYAVILTPTRELCSQIYDILELLTKCNVSIVSGCLIGGEKRKSEKARLRKGVSIVVGTPGRFLDHIRTTESFNLTTLRWFVLDEADRLLDMGFGQTILTICSILTGQVLTPPPSETAVAERSEARSNLQNKWHQHSLHASKLCNEVDSICYLMASATLTSAVKQLAMPLMSGKGFLVIDAEHERINPVRNINDLLMIGKDTGRLDGMTGNNSADKDETAPPAAPAAGAGSRLEQAERMAAPEQLSQYFMMTTCKWKLSALISFINLHKHEKLMIFFSTCDGVDYHALLMNATTWPLALDPQTINDRADNHSLKLPVLHSLEPLDYTFTGLFGPECPMYRLHGNVPQRVRQQVYKSFCKAERGVLFCTDVAARGLDLPKVDWIVQYDPPCETTDYIHRIGRTARRGLGGSAVIFLLPSEAPYVQLLESHGMVPRPLSLQGLFLEVSKDIPGSKKFQNTDEMMAVIIQRRVENTIAQNAVLTASGKQAFCSFIRAYATHSSDAKGIFKVQSLHLGHVAKSFGLRESPSELRCKDDTIGKVFNGMFRAELVESEKKKRRDEKYSLSGAAGKKRGGGESSSGYRDRDKDRKGNKDSNSNGNGTKKRGREGFSSAGSGGGSGEGEREDGDDRRKRSREETKPVAMAGTASGAVRGPPAAAKSKNEKQKLRKIGSGPSPSGTFRKSNGYFRKKLRSESRSEFAH